MEAAPQDRRLGRPGAGAAASLGLFSLILLAIDFSGVHPGLPGRTGAEQIAQLAAQSVRWQQVHGAFFVAGVCSLLGILWLRQVVLPGGLRSVVDVFSIVGILGAVVFASTVFAEVVMIPDLSEACSRSPGCLDPANAYFTEAFADAGWRVLPGLNIGARLLMAGVVALALVGWTTDRLRILEAFPLVAGGGYELIDGTGLHGWGSFRLEDGATGLSAVLFLAGLGAMAVRIWSERRETTPPDPEPDPEADPLHREAEPPDQHGQAIP